MDFNLARVFGKLDNERIDIVLNSYYSFIFLKKNSFYDILKSLESSSVRILISCKTNDQYESISDFLRPFKNISVKNTPSSVEINEHMITIIVNQVRVYFFNINYDPNQRIFSCNLSESLKGDIVNFFYTLFNNTWTALEVNNVLEKRNIFQQDFVDIASHQLRNPILPIIGFSKTLKSKINDPDMLDYLNIIIKNAEKLKNIANDILDISKIEANPLKLDFEIFDLCDLLENIAGDYNQFSNKDSSGINFVFNCTSNILIEADREYVKQAFENILNNSYFFTKKNEGNRIMISAYVRDEDNYASILIEDEGPGITDDNPERVFTKFYPNSGGAGLGLFISKKIIEIHGGTVTVENRIDDIGAKFLIKIPIKGVDMPFQFVGNKSTDENLKLLIIDDFSDNLALIKESITNLGYEIDYYEDPYNAIENFIPGKYSLVFLGINVKGLDGFDLYDDLKKRDKKIKGYFMSSSKINKEAMELLNKNLMYDHFIFKPLSLDSFVKILQSEQMN
ncbi:hybrid sensor histidine kinase/response regulator [Candidatus Nitrosocosmicus hydrocola]|uniref:ATP-binding response regulator n=1 Tax=Candidatus Nitrosocosmicus hydrocola TaxID=1826872 RepID=UPI0011E5BF1D|nr:hybrid sensor histidine kinase/response regulator [Candidatus Nitrosocosmicus hydrocola]